MSLDAPPWLVEWLAGISVWDALLWVAAVVAAIVFIRKKGWRSVIAFARAILATAEVIDNVRELPGFIARTDATLAAQNATLAAQDLKVEEIHHEVHYNNGTSVKDSQRRTELVIKDEILPRLEALTDAISKPDGAE